MGARKGAFDSFFAIYFVLIEKFVRKRYNEKDWSDIMVKSMTGYGTKTSRIDKSQITIEIRSVNSRYLDFIPKTPHSLNNLEAAIKKVIQTNFNRGRIEVYITIADHALSEKTIDIDWDLMDNYVSKIDEIKQRYHLQGETPLSLLTSTEDLFLIEENTLQTESMKEEVLHLLQNVCDIVVAHRTNEGEYLIGDITSRITGLQQTLASIKELQGNVMKQYMQRIQIRIEQYVGEQIELDQTQLVQEIAVMAEKGDITEEIIRLQSHLEHFLSIVKQNETMGRKLDFITQEMHREVNTIGAKSADAKISEAVVTMKSEIEKIKEQVQNIE